MNDDSKIKWQFAATIIWMYIAATPNLAVSSEKYFINNNGVLLYKIINWWYDSLPEESHLLCGNHIKCRAKGNIQIDYNTIEMKIRLYTKESFSDLLSVSKQCDQCWGPSYLKLIWLNIKYFGDGRYIISTDKYSTLNSYLFGQIERTNASKIQSVVNDIGLELEGVICGLMNGKIALHHSGKLLKTCLADKQKQEENFPVSLKILNFQTKEILVKFSVIYNE